MTLFFLLIEIFLYGFAFYIFFKKKELGIIYLPVVFFAFTIIIPTLPLGLFYGFVTVLLLLVIKKKYSLLSENVFSILIFSYYAILLSQASSSIKFSLVYAVLLFFISLPLINVIYKEYSREVILKELTNSATIILVVFIVNVLFASLTKYSESMYGISSGVLYGNLKNTDFNIIGIALFIVLFDILKKNNMLIIAIYVVAMTVILLTMRRSAMLVSILGIPFAILSTLNQKAIGKIFLFVAFFFVVGSAVYYNTDFASVFKERYELRNLDDRALEEEKRFTEYEILYHDMFVLKDYNPWFGYGLFDSAGNYGRGIFDERTLHADIPSIAHSSGILGIILYILMIFTAFYKALRARRSMTDVIIILYCFIVFVIYTITGRYSQVDAMLMLFLVTNLSLAKPEEEQEEVRIEERAAPMVLSGNR